MGAGILKLVLSYNCAIFWTNICLVQIMIFNKLFYSLFISTLSTALLVGCQTADIQPTTKTTVSTNMATPSQQKLLQMLTNYEWQLVQVKGINNKTKLFNHQPPLLMQVIPDLISFNESCHSYQIFFDETYQRPYAYRFSESVKEVTENCKNSSKSNLQTALDTLFKPYATEFRFDWLSQSNTSAKIALSLNNGVELIFNGHIKPIGNTTGLLITNEILERYRWRLVKAVDDNDQPIERFSQVDVPIISRFETDEYSRFAGFSVGCNGASGPYALTTNNTLFIGGSPSTMMGCNERIDEIESDFRRLITHSQSQLVLTEKKSSINSNDTNEKSRYNLLQTMETGETLVWQNEEKQLRR